LGVDKGQGEDRRRLDDGQSGPGLQLQTLSGLEAIGGVSNLLHNPLIEGLPIPSEVHLAECKALAHALTKAKDELGSNKWPRPLSDAAIDAIADRAEEIFEARKKARQRRQKAQQRQRRRRTLQRCLDAIVWEWDNPYLDPGDWVPLKG